MRSILLHANSDPDFEDRFQVALDICRTFDAHLTVVQSIAVDIIFGGDLYGVTTTQLIPVIREQAAQFRDVAEARLAGEDVRWNWVEETGLVDNNILRYAALSDLVILGSHDPDRKSHAPSSLVDRLAIECKVPILVVPDRMRAIDFGKAAVIGWNGSVEASRAVRGAMPLLKRSSAVHLVSIGDHDEPRFDLPLIAGAEYLDRHGVHCEMVELPPGDLPIARTLLEAARARDAAYIVMGAYGTSRIVETLFGGVTRKMLSDPELPIVLAH